MRTIALLLLTSALLFGATFKLYLKDGEYQLVREYQVNGDRIRYYSTERGQWEEIPVALCDLKKTEQERQRTADDIRKQTKLEDDEEKLEREQRREIERIPMNPGAYLVQNDQVKALEPAESNFVTSKKRQTLQKITPIPIVAGKARLELKGEHANLVLHDNEPEFYLRLENETRFGIVQLTPRKGNRVVEDVAIAPITNENFENTKEVPTFKRQLMSGLYKIWPEKPLAAGEYALVEYTGEDVDMIIWDFAYAPGASK